MVVAAGMLFAGPATAQLHDGYDALLRIYALESRVDYHSWSAHKQSLHKLNTYVSQLEAVDAAALSRDDALAYWINLYNATTLKLILDNFPVESIKDLGGVFSSPWKKKLVTVNGRELSLDQIENEIIRPTFGDPRIHFALNCAAVSCPPLAPFAFTGDRIAQQLDDVTVRAMNDDDFVRIERNGDRTTAHLTKLFDWYKDDWSDGVREFLALYRPYDEAVLLDESTRLKYNDYDWKLNARYPTNP